MLYENEINNMSLIFLEVFLIVQCEIEMTSKIASKFENIRV